MSGTRSDPRGPGRAQGGRAGDLRPDRAVPRGRGRRGADAGRARGDVRDDRERGDTGDRASFGAGAGLRAHGAGPARRGLAAGRHRPAVGRLHHGRAAKAGSPFVRRQSPCRTQVLPACAREHVPATGARKRPGSGRYAAFPGCALCCGTWDRGVTAPSHRGRVDRPSAEVQPAQLAPAEHEQRDVHEQGDATPTGMPTSVWSSWELW